MCLDGKECAFDMCRMKVGKGGIGRPKANPSVRGRDKREKAKAASTPICEACGEKPATEVHHVGGRKLGGWNRTRAPLQSLCFECHQGNGHSTGAR